MSELLGSWVDGIPGTQLPIDDRGLQYGDGLFETLLVRKGRVRFLAAHLARLALGCERLGIARIPDDVLSAEILRAAAQAPELAILKLVVTRGSGPRGYAVRGHFSPRRVMSLHATRPLDAAAHGISLRIARQTAGENPSLAGLKHLNRLENVLAWLEPDAEASFDALLFDRSGQIVGGTMSNLFLCRGGAIVTPGVERAGVAGVMRGIVLRECAALGIPAEVRSVAPAELAMADEAFITNARIGVVPVRNVGEHVFHMNQIGARLAAHIEALDA